MLDLPKNQWTIVEAVRRQAERYGERLFVRHEDGSSLSFAGLDRRSSALASGLARLGVSRGDRVTVALFNDLAFLEALVAVNKLGAIFVTLNTELKGAFLEHQVRNSDPKLLIIDHELTEAFGGIDLANLRVEAILMVGGDPDRRPGKIGGKPVISFAGVFDHSASPPAGEEPRFSDISTVIYTSGTTGPAKGVLMPHAHCYLIGYGLAKALGVGEDDIYYVCMPLFHTNALYMQWMGSLLAGAQVALVRRFSATRWIHDVRKYGATVTNALGVMPEFIFRQPPTPYDNQHSLRAMMAAPIAREWGGEFERRFNVKIFQGFGLTETNIVSYTTPDDPLEPGCTGRIAQEWFEVRVVDPETDEEVPAGARGEIVVRPKYPWCFMNGYLNMPERTVEAWRNLWFHTGDAGRFDSEGRLYFIDRIKDCIRRRGENISSYEVEQVINAHPAVAESAVVGIKTADAGGEEEIKACVARHPDRGLSADELIEYCRPLMPRYAVPRFVEFFDALPKTGSNKIKKQELRSQGITPDTWDREAGAPPRRPRA